MNTCGRRPQYFAKYLPLRARWSWAIAPVRASRPSQDCLPVPLAMGVRKARSDDESLKSVKQKAMASKKARRTAIVNEDSSTGKRVGDERRQYFLMKSEPSSFSIDNLESCKNQTEPWNGVRNYAARNIMQSMRLGDKAFFYHSNCKEPSIVGIVEIVQEAYPDDTAFDSESHYFDSKSTLENPRWFMVDVKLVAKLDEPVLLKDLKLQDELNEMQLFRQGRLSVQGVAPEEWAYICSEMIGKDYF